MPTPLPSFNSARLAKCEVDLRVLADRVRLLEDCVPLFPQAEEAAPREPSTSERREARRQLIQLRERIGRLERQLAEAKDAAREEVLDELLARVNELKGPGNG